MYGGGYITRAPRIEVVMTHNKQTKRLKSGVHATFSRSYSHCSIMGIVDKGKKGRGRPTKATENVSHHPGQTLITGFLASNTHTQADTHTPPHPQQGTSQYVEGEESEEESDHDAWRDAHLSPVRYEEELFIHIGREYTHVGHESESLADPMSLSSGADDAGSEHGLEDAGAEHPAQQLGADAHTHAHAQGEREFEDLLRHLTEAPDEDPPPSDGEDDGSDGEEGEDELARDSPQMIFVAQVKEKIKASQTKIQTWDGDFVEVFSLIAEEGKFRFDPPDPCATMREPDGAGFLLQSVIVWDLESLGGVLCCPYCGSPRCYYLGWTRPRRMLAQDRVDLLITRRAECLDCKAARREHNDTGDDEDLDAAEPSVCSPPVFLSSARITLTNDA